MHSSYVRRHYDVIKLLNQNFEGRISILMSVVRDYALKNENQVNSFDAQVTIVVHFVWKSVKISKRDMENGWK